MINKFLVFNLLLMLFNNFALEQGTTTNRISSESVSIQDTLGSLLASSEFSSQSADLVEEDFFGRQYCYTLASTTNGFLADQEENNVTPGSACRMECVPNPQGNCFCYKQCSLKSEHEITKKLKQIQELIAEGLDVNDVDEDGRTLLHESAARKNIQALEVLIKHGAYINSLSDNNNTPLLEVISFCLDNECPISRENAEALDQFENRVIETIKLLLSAGADMSAKDMQGHTLLYKTIKLRFNKVAQFLASVWAEDLDALKLALECGDHEIITAMRKTLRQQRSEMLYEANLILYAAHIPMSTTRRFGIKGTSNYWDTVADYDTEKPGKSRTATTEFTPLPTAQSEFRVIGALIEDDKNGPAFVRRPRDFRFDGEYHTEQADERDTKDNISV